MVKGQDMEGCGAVPPCSSRIYSFAVKHLVGGLRLPLVTGVSGEGLARHRMEESEDPLEPTGICISVTTSNPADFHSENSGCCFTSASKSHANPSFASFTQNHMGKAILENEVSAYPI